MEVMDAAVLFFEPVQLHRQHRKKTAFISNTMCFMPGCLLVMKFSCCFIGLLQYCYLSADGSCFCFCFISKVPFSISIGTHCNNFLLDLILRAERFLKAMIDYKPKGAPLSMQQVDTELRLLGLLLRQYETNPRRGRVPLAAAAEADAPGETGGAPLVPLGPGSFGQPRAKVKADLQPAGGTCPACASAEIYISRARSPFERLLERWRVPICRCHRCYHRYVVFARLKIAKHLPAESEHGAPTRRRT